MTQTAKQPVGSILHTSRSSRISGTRALGIAAAVIAIAFQTGPAASQSAGNFEAKAIAKTSSQPPVTKAAAPHSNESQASAIVPSRFVGEAEFDAHIQFLTSQLSMKSRQTDPFGQLQDPNAKPIIKPKVGDHTKRIAQVQATPFPDIISQIRVNAIMPREKKFLIGTKTYTQGGTLSIIHRGKTILVQILSVKARQIDLKNSETSETASLKIEALPVGMTPGTEGISAPGMAPDVQDAPINLDVGTP
jgi:hypothetical protein